VILITPRALQDPAVARQITEEFRRKMESLKLFYESPKAKKPKTTRPPMSSGEAVPREHR